MAATKIADVIIPEWFAPYTINRTMELSALWTSGIIGALPGTVPMGTQGGTTLVLPFWNDLTGAEEILSDTVPLSVDKITTGRDVAVLHARGKAWGANDLATALSGSDPMAAIGELVASFWARRMQAVLIATLNGIFAAASMSGNISDISAGTGDDANLGLETGTDAIFLLGDAYGGLSAWAMHSAVVASLTKIELTETMDADVAGGVPVVRFLGKPIIVDDGLPQSGGVYTSYLFGQGAIGYDEGGAPVPVETDRDSLQGDDILINRRHFVLHPRGVRWQGTPAGVSPTNAELATGTNWLRVFSNKQIRIVAVKHKIG